MTTPAFFRFLVCVLSVAMPAVLLIASAPPVIGAVFSDDPTTFRDPRFAVTADDQRLMLAPIGHSTTTEPVLLQNPDGESPNEPDKKYGIAAGTVYMVSPCIALTNYHVVFGLTPEKPGAAQKEYKVKVSIGDKMAVGIPFLWGNFAQEQDNDWAALKVTPCIGSATGWLSITYSKQPLPREVSIFGFYGDQDFSVLAGQNCVLLERAPSSKIWKTNCAVMHGTSGSPIGIFKDGKFEPTAMAFAMVSHKTAKLTYDRQDANFAVDLYRLFLDAPSLGTIIAEDLKSYGAENPARLPPNYQHQAPKARQPLMPGTLAGLPRAPQNIALPPAPQPVALPPEPVDIGLPPTPRPLALPPDPVLVKP